MNQENEIYDIAYRLTEQELYLSLQRGLRKAGVKRLIAETGLLVLVAAWCLIPYFFGRAVDHDIRSLVPGAVAVLLIGVLWLLPRFRFRAQAREEAAAGTEIVMQIDADNLTVGRENKTEIPFADAKFKYYPDMVILKRGVEILPIPRRVCPEGAWEIIERWAK